MDTSSEWKKTRPSRTTSSKENVERVRTAVLKSLERSTSEHAPTISHRIVGRILHEDLKSHLYKLAVVQKLNIFFHEKGRVKLLLKPSS